MKTIIVIATLAICLLMLQVRECAAEQVVAVDGPRVHWTWPPNPEPDIMGYGVYQTIGNASSPFVLLAEVSAPEYYTDIAWGEVQYLKLDAIDWVGNRSPLNASSLGAIRDFAGAPVIPATARPGGRVVEFIRSEKWTITETVTP